MIPDRFRPLVDSTSELAQLFSDAGHHLYLVGGTVRDAFAAGDKWPGKGGDGATDIDLTTDARPEEIESIVSRWADAVWLQGKRFGTVACRHGGKKYEITTHRAETYQPGSRKPTVCFGSSIEEDLSRRDFTVNAIALALPTLELIDPWGGLDDLASATLRTPLAPDTAFKDDPLRMLRAARFIARFGLRPTEDLVEAVQAGASNISVVSFERVRDELDKLMVASKPGPGLWFLIETGLAAQILPELPALALEQDPIHHHKDVLAHTIAVVEKTSPDRILRLAALFHDVGKPRTRAFGSEGVSFHHHEVVGARMARERMKALRYPTADIQAVSRLVELHLRFHTYRMGWTDRAVRRYVRDAGPLLDRLNELTRCDCTTRNAAKARALSKRMDDLESRISELRAKEELDSIRPEVDGTQVMQHLGLAPGPEVGAAMAFLMELRMEEGLLGPEECLRRLASWWQQRSSGAP
ncbi:MAG: CCA tRNA nucleotidyltransferase [Actinobacteria bacterium]|nr:CCA tRNA nucleotidyltransferase [Actinomycetota bacterium]